MIPSVIALCLGAPLPTAIPRDAESAVRGVMPKGWAVSIKGESIVIRRDKDVGVFNTVGLPPMLDERVIVHFTQPYLITLRFRAQVGLEEYKQLRRENAAIDRKLEVLRDGLRAARIRHKFDDWLPETDEQKSLVAEYRAAQKANPWHRLPDGYTETHSVEIGDPVPFPLAISRDEERKECEAVMKAVRGLFKSYPE